MSDIELVNLKKYTKASPIKIKVNIYIYQLKLRRKR